MGIPVFNYVPCLVIVSIVVIYYRIQLNLNDFNKRYDKQTPIVVVVVVVFNRSS